ncbi:MAG: 2-succinyl-5-enolpyruvyl-6-hydroxy-3-cyclohexene-1-carboxylic-acid synthase [Prochlorotrichaceae cyanobacterium]|jgi:2-succinyl-5-enolpyruvyl-6-hydroxy-3-cyclohexene-1-carboxylate synthase
MDLDFRTLNSLWASVLVNTLAGLGLRYSIICPGSRSAPLAVAFSHAKTIETIPILDERSAAFFALGLAKRLQQPVAVVCTSGTAGANLYGAVIEAAHTGVPLLIFTADRPPELRDCHAGQTIDQQKLFSHFPRWQVELALPNPVLAGGAEARTHLAYLRQTIIQAWERSHYPVPGPVHLNCPFREPLAPHPDAQILALAQDPQLQRFQGESQELFDRWSWDKLPPYSVDERVDHGTLNFGQYARIVLLVGPCQPSDPAFVEQMTTLAQTLHCPVLTDALNPLRNAIGLRPFAIASYDFILRNADRAEALHPQVILQVGELPTSKTLRQWLSQRNVLRYVLTAGSPDNLDPLQGTVIHLRSSLASLVAFLTPKTIATAHPVERRTYLQTWHTFDQQYRTEIETLFTAMADLREPKVAWLLAQTLPPETLLFVANSTPVRDMEWFWLPTSCRPLQPFFNRGANGIDGTLSTALGLVHGSDRPGVLLTGDLSLLHDTNGFLQRSIFRGSLTIVLINNQGGGIFELLPIAEFEPPFEAFFATPQTVNFEQLCGSYGVAYTRIENWQHLETHLKTLPAQGIQVLEVRTDRRADALWRKEYFKQLSQ